MIITVSIIVTNCYVANIYTVALVFFLEYAQIVHLVLAQKKYINGFAVNLIELKKKQILKISGEFALQENVQNISMNFKTSTMRKGPLEIKYTIKIAYTDFVILEVVRLTWSSGARFVLRNRLILARCITINNTRVTIQNIVPKAPKYGMMQWASIRLQINWTIKKITKMLRAPVRIKDMMDFNRILLGVCCLAYLMGFFIR